MGYIGVCGPKRYGFGHKLGIDFAHFGHKYGTWFFYSILDLGMFLRRGYFFIISDKTINKTPLNIMLRATVPAATVINRISNFWLGH